MIAFSEALADLLRSHGVDLLVGSTLVMGSIALAIVCTRSRARRHRLAGSALLASAAYLVVAVVPLPRLSFGDGDDDVGREPATPIAAMAHDALATVPTNQPQRTPTPTLLLSPSTDAPTERPPATALIAAHERTTTPRFASPPIAADRADLASWLAAVGIVGALAFALHLAVGWLRLRAVLADSRPASTAVQTLVELPRNTRVRVARRAAAPFCFGLVRRTIVLPAHLARPSDATRFVLLHERAHLRAGDTSLRALAALLRPLLYWHPLFWWLQRELRFSGELLADDAAADGSVAAYVRCMMTLAERSTPSPTSPLVATVFRRRSELFRRLEMMLTRNESLTRSSRTPWWLRAVSTTALVAVCAGAFGVERAVAQDPQRAELESEIVTMRAQIAKLKAELTRMQRDVAAAPAPAVDPFPEDHATTTYTVQRGDTLGRIAVRCYGSKKGFERILKLNPDLDADRLEVGQQIKIDAKSAGRAAAPVLAEIPLVGNLLATPPEPVAPRQPVAPIEPIRPIEPIKPIQPTQPTAPAAPTHSRPVTVGMTPPPPEPSWTRGNRTTHQGSTEGGSLSEIVDLVTRCIELDGECEIRKVELFDAKHTIKDAADKRTGKRDYEIAKVRLETTERKRNALRAILRQELENARSRAEHGKKLHAQGLISRQELMDAVGRVKALERGMR